MPFVIAYLPALGLSFLADEGFHQWMALACFLIAIVAFVPGLRKHGNWIPISIATVGLFMITFAAMGWAGDCCPSCEENKLAASGTTATLGAGCEDCEDCATSEANENNLATLATATSLGAGCEHCEDCATSEANENNLATLATAASLGAGCEHCEDCSTSEANQTVQSTDNGSRIGIEAEEEAALLLLLAPWITPIGGLLLVSAHLCNRRFGCLCGCCGDVAEPTAMELDHEPFKMKE
ncbi:MAG: MerC domain-containing protein [Mariniblastus sp.]|nr:MerC domain-containing protein [Mariniblastus sp.]